MIQILLAILAGLLTVGAPCILPILPILLGASVGQKSKSRPLFITFGFIVTFALAGLFLSLLVSRFHFSADSLRHVAVIALALFGLFMLWPLPFELLTAKLSGLINQAQQTASRAGSGNFGGFVLGVMLGIIWTPCAGPVLGSILTLIATQTKLTQASVLLLAYALGAGIPMLVISYGSQWITAKIRVLANHARLVQQIFGAIIILWALAIYLGYDLIIQAKIIEHYPGLTPTF